MKQEKKGILKTIWEMRHLTVEECLSTISNNSDLKFLVTTVGIWFLLRWFIGIWIGAHLIYFFYRLFILVMA
ncbi:hypothetical protein AQULUS_24140 (plasmid) [Aquicella lusitana]|uniref:Uncharacterized protein n=1 Tax=Aquicella lusitana TaxID=254246 RepID=A0A370GBE9_9COXI|nr:hypothetical protein C8D86_12123 [Aquicella lusitana]VVC74648.1 hypothetical protein AQULUS_24140 [Aquicella lusitana]